MKLLDLSIHDNVLTCREEWPRTPGHTSTNQTHSGSHHPSQDHNTPSLCGLFLVSTGQSPPSGVPLIWAPINLGPAPLCWLLFLTVRTVCILYVLCISMHPLSSAHRMTLFKSPLHRHASYDSEGYTAPTVCYVKDCHRTDPLGCVELSSVPARAQCGKS